jgi:hypothetical protein
LAFPDFIPVKGQMNYPDDIEALFKQDPTFGRIIDTRAYPYVDFYGRRFDQDVRFINRERTMKRKNKSKIVKACVSGEELIRRLEENPAHVLRATIPEAVSTKQLKIC